MIKPTKALRLGEAYFSLKPAPRAKITNFSFQTVDLKRRDSKRAQAE